MLIFIGAKLIKIIKYIAMPYKNKGGVLNIFKLRLV